MVKAADIALGQQSLMSDLGMKVVVGVWTDSIAAVGICGRSGLGKLRHVQTHKLWVRERVRSEAIELRKVNGLVNPADLFTKHLNSRDRINQLVELFDCEYRDGRATTAPELKKTTTTAIDSGSKHAEIHLNDDGNRRLADNDGSTATAHIDIHEQSTMHGPESSRTCTCRRTTT